MPAYPYSIEDDKKTDVLIARLQAVRREEEKILKELRPLIYKAERPR